MALVIMGHRRRASLLEGQARLRPIERLDLGLLIDAEHKAAIRRVEVDADDLGHLLLEQRVVRDLEPFHDVRLQPSIGLYAPHARRRIPTSSAIIVRLQCVALGGVSCTVFAIAFSWTSLGRGGTREGRVMSCLSPGTPSSRYRSRQRQTVGFDISVRRMISTVP